MTNTPPPFSNHSPVKLKRSLWALTCCGYVVVFEDLNEGGMPTEDGSETLHGTCFKCNTSYTVSIYTHENLFNMPYSP